MAGKEEERHLGRALLFSAFLAGSLMSALSYAFFAPVSKPSGIAGLALWPMRNHTCNPPYASKAPQFYSQGEGERIDEFMYTQFFSNYCSGVFLDIGANDGRTFSNSLFFEEMLGWHGLCVEPHPLAFAKLAQARPRCINIAGGVSNTRSQLKFMQLSGYTEMLSGFVEGMDEAHKHRIESELAVYGGSKQIIDVQSFSLADLLAQYDIRHVDFMSLDVEGHELAVLESIDFDHVQFKTLVIEENNERAAADVLAFLAGKGYQRIRSVAGFNGLWVPLKQPQQ